MLYTYVLIRTLCRIVIRLSSLCIEPLLYGMTEGFMCFIIILEARTPEVKLTFEANAEASRDECNRLSESVNVDEIINRTISWCPSSCTCTPGDITPSSEDENDCLVRLPVSFVCGGEGLEKQIAMLWSLIHAAVALDEDIAITKYLSIPNIETTCPEGWSLHMSDDVEPRCSKLVKSFLDCQVYHNFIHFSYTPKHSHDFRA